jgi:hypothetical protein
MEKYSNISIAEQEFAKRIIADQDRWLRRFFKSLSDSLGHALKQTDDQGQPGEVVRLALRRKIEASDPYNHIK